MNRHQNFLDNLYKGKKIAMRSLELLEQIPYKGLRVRRIIKQTKRYIEDMVHNISIEEKWGVND